MKLRLQRAGYDVAAHNKSLGTMVTILREHPDLILLDFELPLIDACALCASIRQLPSMAHLANMPVIFYTALAEDQIEKMVKRCGAQGYISKSLTIEKVVERINEFIYGIDLT